MHSFQLFFLHLHLTKTDTEGKESTGKMKDISVEGECEFVILPACVGEWWLHFFSPREKRWRVSSLMCFTSADVVSRPGPSHGRQISFSCTDVMSRHWVDTGQCWGTPLTDDNHSSILIVFLFLCSSVPHSLPTVSTLFICGLLTVYQERNRTSWANKCTHSGVNLYSTSLVPEVCFSIRRDWLSIAMYTEIERDFGELEDRTRIPWSLGAGDGGGGASRRKIETLSWISQRGRCW